MFPLTSNFAVGVVVPIPTFPLLPLTNSAELPIFVSPPLDCICNSIGILPQLHVSSLKLIPSSSIFNSSGIFISLSILSEILSLTFKLPLTSNFAPGSSIPIPTFPLDRTNLGILSVINNNAEPQPAIPIPSSPLSNFIPAESPPNTFPIFILLFLPNISNFAPGSSVPIPTFPPLPLTTSAELPIFVSPPLLCKLYVDGIPNQLLLAYILTSLCDSNLNC
jgi:hypothetical protein